MPAASANEAIDWIQRHACRSPVHAEISVHIRSHRALFGK
jgi:hypothetical protein